MNEICFYCKICKKSMKMAYLLSGDDSSPVLPRMTIRCHTNKCKRSLVLMHYTEKMIKDRADATGKCFI